MIRQRVRPAIERGVSGAYWAITPSASWAAATTSSSLRHWAIVSATPASRQRRRSASLCGKLVSRMTTVGGNLALDAGHDDALDVEALGEEEDEQDRDDRQDRLRHRLLDVGDVARVQQRQAERERE